MAQQDGLLKFKGQMGGISFYKTAEDGYLARQKGGIDAERIKNSPEFVRTRENGSEFGRAGAAGKLLRTALRILIANAADSRMASRLTAEMVKVIQADATSRRGERNVIDGEAELLQGFEFNQRSQLSRTFFAPFTVTFNRVTGSVQTVIKPFVPGNMIGAPPGATHAKIVLGATGVDFEAGVYTATTTSFADLAVDSIVQTGQLQEELLLLPNNTHPMFAVFGVEFYQQVNGQKYSLKNGAYNALSLVKVDGGGA